MVGAFPPPVHGMAAVNAQVLKLLKKVGVEPCVIDISAPSLNRSFVTRLSRLPKIIRGLIRLLFQDRIPNQPFYMSVSGGLGQVYEILFLIVARFYRMRIYMHHHSFAYLNRSSCLTRILTRIAGKHSIHITQSQGMKERLLEKYPCVRKVVPISNVVFLMHPKPKHVPHTRLRTIGFISNIAEEKGIFEFLSLIAACESNALKLEARIAGPFQDSRTEQKVRQRIGELSTVKYLGPLYGEAKQKFFDSIDALIFPTLYYNETEGIVNHEALCQGLPVIAYGRGCIPEIVTSECGLAINPAEPFVPAALDLIKQWIADSGVYNHASRSACEQFSQVLEENMGRWENLLGEIINVKNEDLSILE